MKLRLLLSVLVLGTSPSDLIASPQQALGTVSGVVRAADTAAGIPLVNIRIVGTDLGASSNENGEFTIRGIPPGTYSIRFSAVGFQTRTIDEVGVQDVAISVGIIELQVWTLRLQEVVVSPGRFTIMGAETGSRQTLSEENLRNMSWAEDITRAVSRLPGISSTDFSSKFTIRGGEADEVLITLDGMELYEPFHQRDKAGGLFSIVDIETVQGVDLMTGGYSAEYGNRMSGVFSMRTRNVHGQPRRTTLGLSMMNARFFTQGTFSNGKGSYLASARRGMLDLTFKIVPDAEVVPKFHDALLKINYRLTPKHSASLHVLEAGDKTSIDDLDEEGNFDKNETKYLNVYAWATLTSIYSPKLFSRTILYTGMVNHDRNGSFHKYEPSDKGDFLLRDKRDYAFTGLRQDWNWAASERLGVAAGFETKQVNAVYDYDIDQQELRVDGSGRLYDYVREEDIHMEPSGNQTGAYLSARLKVAPRVAIEPSIRFDHSGFTGDDLVSPRIGIVFAVSDRTFLRAATGRYYQSQFINDIDVNNGESTFSPAQLATHFVVGLEHQTRSGIDIRLEAYHKDMSRLTSNWVTLRDQQEMFPEQRNDNAQLILDGARADGIELFVKYDQGKKLSWWISYALARAEDDVRDIVFDAPLDKQTGWVSRPNLHRTQEYSSFEGKT